jgi:hypothetical protein
MSDQYTPEAIANLALDAAGIDFTIGSLSDGTRPAQVTLRRYYDTMKQLLRASHWSFARKEAPLQLAAAVGGQTTDALGNVVTVPSQVPAGFQFSYDYPSDCLMVRYVPANYWNVTPAVPPTNITPAGGPAPLTTGLVTPVGQSRPVPTRFLITSDMNYIPDGAGNDIPGVAPIGVTRILSNVQNARCVYTYDCNYVNLWDDLFREAMVASLAAQIALPLAADKKMGMAMRQQNIAIALERIREARAKSSNEGWSSSDISVDWIRIRNSGSPYGYWGGGNGYGGGAGYLCGGFGAMWFENSSSY